MGSDIEVAVQWAKRLETLLESDFGATGKGLHEKISSVQKRLPAATSRKLRFIATVRNKIVHETSYSKIEDRGRFERTCLDVVSELKSARSLRLGESAQTDEPSRGDRFEAARTTGSATGPSWWFALLSPFLSVVGGVAGFTSLTIRGEGLIPAVFGAILGAVAGFYWQTILTSVLLAFAIIVVFWLCMFVRTSLH